jgi:DNA primase catalytic core
MSTRTAADRASAAQAKKLEELHARLTDQIAELTSGADWKAWLRVAARFHSYSFGNTMLILAQRPDATQVAGYRAWQLLGRQVDKGERGIQILAPVTRREQAGPDGAAAEATTGAGSKPDVIEVDADRLGTRHVVGWRVAHVWDVSQTTGEPLPERPTPTLLSGQAPDGVWDALVAQAEAARFAVQRGDCDGANGYTHFGQRVIRVRADVDDAQALKTLAHELGHVCLHDPGQKDRTTRNCRGVAEVEAESVAFLVCANAGAATEDYTFPYVAGWASEANSRDPASVVAEAGRRVLSAANSIIGDLDAVRGRNTDGEREHRALDRALAPVHVDQDPPSATRTVEPRPERLLAVHGAAAAWYREQLLGPDADGPRTYLDARGLGHVLQPVRDHDPWEIGYAPHRWTALVDHLRAEGCTDAELEAGGLAFRSRKGSLVDRFRDRIMLPIRDELGQVVAFIGRAPDDRDVRTPKYLNSPHTAIYHKAESLFGVGSHPLAGQRVILVEGPLDVLAVHAAVPAVVAVAPCGTAFTEAQAKILGAAGVRDIVVAFDADHGGRAAAVRAYSILRPHISSPLVAQLPEGTDPASLAETNPADLARAVTEHVRPLSDMVVDERIAQLKGGQIESAEGRSLAARDLGALIATMPAAQVPRQVARTAEAIGVLQSTMTAVVAEAISPVELSATRSSGAMATDSARPDRPMRQAEIARTAFSKREAEGAIAQSSRRQRRAVTIPPTVKVLGV